MNRQSAADRARQLLAEHLTRAAEASLHEFVRQAWHVLEPTTKFVDGEHIRAICLHLEAVTRGEIRTLVINMPPRHMKSLLLVLWMVWTWIRRPSSRWLVASYALSLSIRDNLKARRLIESPWFRKRWGHVFELTTDQNVKSRFDNSKTGYRLASAVKAGVTGEGGDFIVVDDAHNVIDADSDQKRATAITWWDESISTRGNDPETVARVICGQRVHTGDLAGHAIAKGNAVVLSLPAEYVVPQQRLEDGTVVPLPKPVNAIGWSDWRNREGELLWPERFSRAALDALKLDLGTYGTAGQLQQTPTPRGGAMVKRAWLKFYKVLPPLTTDWMLSIDCAFKDEADSDYVCIGVWCRLGAQWFLVYRVKEQLDITATITAIRTVAKAYPKAVLKLVEDKANGSAVLSTLKREVPGLVPYEPLGSKVARLNAVAPSIEAGNLHLPIDAEWLEDYIYELINFPKVTNDDQVDMTSMALSRYLNPTTVRIW